MCGNRVLVAVVAVLPKPQPHAKTLNPTTIITQSCFSPLRGVALGLIISIVYQIIYQIIYPIIY